MTSPPSNVYSAVVPMSSSRLLAAWTSSGLAVATGCDSSAASPTVSVGGWSSPAASGRPGSLVSRGPGQPFSPNNPTAKPTSKHRNQGEPFITIPIPFVSRPQPTRPTVAKPINKPWGQRLPPRLIFTGCRRSVQPVTFRILGLDQVSHAGSLQRGQIGHL